MAKNRAKKRKEGRLLSIKDAASWLGVTTWAMRERIWAGHIPVVTFPGGRKMYVDRIDLELFIKRNKSTYVSQLIKKKYKIHSQDVNPEMIELKQKHLEVIREIRSKKKNQKEIDNVSNY